MNDKVKESGEYDNFLGQKNEAEAPGSLGEFLGMEEDETDPRAWKKHWKGMPEFENEANPSFKTISVHFRNEADYVAFAKLIGQNLTEKTKSIWHPKLDRDAYSLKRWIED